MQSNVFNDRELEIDVGRGVHLEAELTLPWSVHGLVIFAHGSGSSRHTYRNADVAARLQADGFGTLLFNLLTRAEEAQECLEPRRQHDIPFLANRLVAVAHWARCWADTRHLPFGLFGADSGGAAAIMTAAQIPDQIDAVVSRGGRPDLAADGLRRTLAPTLLLVGGWDDATLQANREALSVLRCEKRLEIVREATHRFDEPGAIARVADFAGAWFQQHLAGGTHPIRSRAIHVTKPAP